MIAITDLPNEILFKVFSHLSSKDIHCLHCIPDLNDRIDGMFCAISDVEPPVAFKHIPRHIGLIRSADIVEADRKNTLSAIMEIHDLKHSHKYISPVTHVLDTYVSIFDDYIPITWEFSENSCLWLTTLGPRVKCLSFENLQKVCLADISLDPNILRFPRLRDLRLLSCDVAVSSMPCKFDFPGLTDLYVDTLFSAIHNCIDYSSTCLKHLTLTGVRDIPLWSNIHCPSLEELVVVNIAGMIGFENLTFERLKHLFIRDTDIAVFAFMNLPEVRTIHIEQFANAEVSLHHIDAPKLRELLLWINTIEDFYEIHIPSIEVASIMLSHEPVPSDDRNIDLSCMAGLKSLKICCAAEILQHTPRLQHLEVRGPLDNTLLYTLTFPKLSELSIYFNHNIRRAPDIHCPKLKKLSFSRCISLQDISSIEQWYPELQTLSIEYCELKEISHIATRHLQRFTFLSSTSAPFSVINCDFPSLRDFEARNLEIKNWMPSEFDFTAPELTMLTISNFTVDHLDVTRFPKLLYCTATGGIRTLKIRDCPRLIHLNVSANKEMTMIDSDTLGSLTALVCKDMEYLVNHDLDTPLLKKVIYGEMVMFAGINETNL